MSKMKRFETQIKSAFGLSGQTFFNCLGMLSFMNVNEPRNAYVLTQIEVIKGNIRLQSEFKTRENGFKTADASKRLVVELDRFRGLCRQFYKSAPAARDLRKDLDGFIETITNRNAHIDYFNSLLVEMRQLAGEMGALELQKSTLQRFDGGTPGEPRTRARHPEHLSHKARVHGQGYRSHTQQP
jgi:hypothetical protein